MNTQLPIDDELAIMANNFFQLRETHQLTISSLSQATGIPASILEDIEQERDFDAVHLMTLSRFYNLCPSTLFQPLFPIPPDKKAVAEHSKFCDSSFIAYLYLFQCKGTKL